MAEIDVERSGNKRRKNNNLWVWIVVVIIAFLVAWIALSERSDVGEVEPEPEPVVTFKEDSDISESFRTYRY